MHPELKAMSTITKALESLEKPAQERVLGWVTSTVYATVEQQDDTQQPDEGA